MAETAHISVLYLDDDVAGARLVQRRLGRHGFKVETATDGMTGIQRLREGVYDVLVTDHDMPVMTGLDVIRRLVEEDSLPPTIMVTGLGDESMAVEALKLGVDDYIVKDVGGNYLELLPTVIGEVLSRKHLQKQRRQLEQALRDSEAWFRSVFEGSRDAVCIINEDTRFEDVNAAVTGLSGYTKNELRNMRFRDILHTEDYPLAARTFERVMAGEALTIEVSILCRDGHAVDVELSNTRIYIGGLPYLHIVMRDITEHKRMEALAERQRQQLIHADKMVALGTLVSGVAHEINNPNNNIMLNSTLLTESWESIRPVLDHYFEEHEDFVVGGLPYEEMRSSIPELFAGIYDGSQRIKRIVSDLKDFARQDAAQMDQRIDVNASVQRALALASHLVRKRTSHLTVALADALPPVKGNAQRLEQVLVNLLHNACQALDDHEKGVHVTTCFIPNERMIEIRIADEGYGMSEETIERIMDPFFTTRRDEGGTGLGLSVSAGIIEEHNGALRFDSALGRGTTAILRLPAASSGNDSLEERYSI